MGMSESNTTIHAGQRGSFKTSAFRGGWFVAIHKRTSSGIILVDSE
jgi:hypothetical protein